MDGATTPSIRLISMTALGPFSLIQDSLAGAARLIGRSTGILARYETRRFAFSSEISPSPPPVPAVRSVRRGS
jgi:hypothetical protein